MVWGTCAACCIITNSAFCPQSVFMFRINLAPNRFLPWYYASSVQYTNINKFYYQRIAQPISLFHTHTRARAQNASAIPYTHFLGSGIYKENTRSRNLTSSTVNGKIHCKYIIILSKGGTYNINRQKLYRTQIKVRRSQTSKTDKINLEIAEWLKSLHHEAVCTMDELYVLYWTVQ
jgi:hypothetical protein